MLTIIAVSTCLQVDLFREMLLFRSSFFAIFDILCLIIILGCPAKLCRLLELSKFKTITWL